MSICPECGRWFWSDRKLHEHRAKHFSKKDHPNKLLRGRENK